MNDLVLRPQRVLSLCSGAGGLDLGVHDALGGCARSVLYLEHETTACEVLAARIADGALDDAPIWGDLHAFDARGWRGRVDGIIGGYPCQPFSVAGKRLGVNDPRHLWPSIARIIAECEPDWCFFENVGGHLRLGYWDVVRPDLERLGYRVAEGLFTAAEVGAPHQRERLFILAHRESAGREARWSISGGGSADGAGTLALRGELAHAAIGGQRERGEPSGGDGQPDGGSADVAHAEVDYGRRGERGTEAGIGPDGERRGRPASDGGTLDDAERKRSGGSVECAGRGWNGTTSGTGGTLPAFPPGPSDTDAWQRILAERPDLAPAVEPPVHGVADGLAPGMDLSRAARLRITGNGVVPAQASHAFRTLWGQLADAGHAEREDGQHAG